MKKVFPNRQGKREKGKEEEGRNGRYVTRRARSLWIYVSGAFCFVLFSILT